MSTSEAGLLGSKLRVIFNFTGRGCRCITMLVLWCGGVVARSQMYEMLQSAGIRHYQSGLMHLVAGSSGTHNVIYTNVFDFPKTFKVAHSFYYNL